MNNCTKHVILLPMIVFHGNSPELRSKQTVDSEVTLTSFFLSDLMKNWWMLLSLDTVHKCSHIHEGWACDNGSPLALKISLSLHDQKLHFYSHWAYSAFELKLQTLEHIYISILLASLKCKLCARTCISSGWSVQCSHFNDACKPTGTEIAQKKLERVFSFFFFFYFFFSQPPGNCVYLHARIFSLTSLFPKY